MEKIPFECETITPMFLTGADGETPELRPPSIKAAMRFWWRAINADKSLKQLKEEEAKIFGGSGKNEGRSKFDIRTEIVLSGNIGKERPLPHSLNRTFSIPCINKGVSFYIYLIRLTDELKNLFILVSILGGFGKRSRRGFGSIKINKIEGCNTSFPINDINFTLKVLNKLKLDGFKKDASDTSIVINYAPNGYSNYPFIKKIQIGNKSNKMDDLLVKIGKSSHDNDCYATGFTEKVKQKNYRLASPVYVSIQKNINSDYFPIVTTLNLSSEEDFKKWNVKFPKEFNETKYNDFINSLNEDDKIIINKFYPGKQSKYKLQMDGNDENDKKKFYAIIKKMLEKSIYDKRVDRSTNFIGDILK